MIKAILFDFDGTLADTLPYYVKAYNKALTSLGFIFTEKEIVNLCFGKKETYICERLNIPEKTKEFSTAYFNSVRELFKKAKLSNGTIELLNNLRIKKIKLAVITFAYRWYIDEMLTQFNLNRYFDNIISTDDVTHPKPDPEAVLKLCKLYHIKPEEALVVGDSKSDILMAGAAGSRSVLIYPPHHDLFYDFKELKKANPTHTIDSIDKLASLI